MPSGHVVGDRQRDVSALSCIFKLFPGLQFPFRLQVRRRIDGRGWTDVCFVSGGRIQAFVRLCRVHELQPRHEIRGDGNQNLHRLRRGRVLHDHWRNGLSDLRNRQVFYDGGGYCIQHMLELWRRQVLGNWCQFID